MGYVMTHDYYRCCHDYERMGYVMTLTITDAATIHLLKNRS